MLGTSGWTVWTCIVLALSTASCSTCERNEPPPASPSGSSSQSGAALYQEALKNVSSVFRHGSETGRTIALVRAAAYTEPGFRRLLVFDGKGFVDQRLPDGVGWFHDARATPEALFVLTDEALFERRGGSKAVWRKLQVADITSIRSLFVLERALHVVLPQQVLRLDAASGVWKQRWWVSRTPGRQVTLEKFFEHPEESRRLFHSSIGVFIGPAGGGELELFGEHIGAFVRLSNGTLLDESADWYLMRRKNDRDWVDAGEVPFPAAVSVVPCPWSRACQVAADSLEVRREPVDGDRIPMTHPKGEVVLSKLLVLQLFTRGDEVWLPVVDRPERFARALGAGGMRTLSLPPAPKWAPKTPVLPHVPELGRASLTRFRQGRVAGEVLALMRAATDPREHFQQFAYARDGDPSTWQGVSLPDVVARDVAATTTTWFVLAAGTDAIHASDDRGASWKVLPPIPPIGQQGATSLFAHGDRLHAITQRTIRRLVPGGAWQTIWRYEASPDVRFVGLKGAVHRSDGALFVTANPFSVFRAPAGGGVLAPWNTGLPSHAHDGLFGPLLLREVAPGTMIAEVAAFMGPPARAVRRTDDTEWRPIPQSSPAVTVNMTCPWDPSKRLVAVANTLVLETIPDDPLQRGADQVVLLKSPRVVGEPIAVGQEVWFPVLDAPERFGRAVSKDLVRAFGLPEPGP